MINNSQSDNQRDTPPSSKEAILFEQIGSTDAVSRPNSFMIDLGGAAEGDINPLPDIDEI